jgi:hypothetical protein
VPVDSRRRQVLLLLLAAGALAAQTPPAQENHAGIVVSLTGRWLLQPAGAAAPRELSVYSTFPAGSTARLAPRQVNNGRKLTVGFRSGLVSEFVCSPLLDCTQGIVLNEPGRTTTPLLMALINYLITTPNPRFAPTLGFRGDSLPVKLRDGILPAAGALMLRDLVVKSPGAAADDLAFKIESLDTPQPAGSVAPATVPLAWRNGEPVLQAALRPGLYLLTLHQQHNEAYVSLSEELWLLIVDPPRLDDANRQWRAVQEEAARFGDDMLRFVTRPQLKLLSGQLPAK